MGSLETSQASDVVQRANLVYSDGSSLVFLDHDDYKHVLNSSSLFKQLTKLLDPSKNYIVYPSNSALHEALTQKEHTHA